MKREFIHDNRLQEVYIICKGKVHLIKRNFDCDNMRWMERARKKNSSRFIHFSLVFARKNQERSFRVAVVREFTDAKRCCTRDRPVAFKVKRYVRKVIGKERCGNKRNEELRMVHWTIIAKILNSKQNLFCSTIMRYLEYNIIFYCTM
jgi:hypothetical protein